MFQEFPYTNFHELNLDWIVKIAKDFLDQYTHIQEVIQTGLEDLTESRETGLAELDQKRLDSLAELNQKTLDGLADLQNKYDTLNGLLQAWYDTHSADIAGQLADAIIDFNTAAEAKSQALLDSWPADYSELVTGYNNLKNELKLITNESLIAEYPDISNIIDGKFINKWNELENNANWNIIKGITINEGETIIVYCISVNTVSVIAQDNGDDTYINIVNATDSNYKKYSYTASETTNIAISVNKTENNSIFILKVNVPQELQKIESNFNDIETIINASEIIEIPQDTTTIEKKYIDIYGALQNNNNYLIVKNIELKKDQTIYVITNSENNVSVISEDNSGTYTSLIKATQVGVQTFAYQTLEDIEIALSVKTTDNYLFYIKSIDMETVNEKVDIAYNEMTNAYTDIPGGEVTQGKNVQASASGTLAIVSNAADAYRIFTANVGEYVGLHVDCTAGSNTRFSVGIFCTDDNNIILYRYNQAVTSRVQIDIVTPPGTKKIFVNGYQFNPSAKIIYKVSPKLNYTSLSLFEKFGVIGDSFASGELYYNSDYHDKYNISWGQILARKLGTTCTNYSHGGLTTRSWLENAKGLQLVLSSPAEDIYYSALGINDVYSLGPEYLGTIDDITEHSSYVDYPDTFYGNYGKIIEQVLGYATHAKMVLFTCAATTGNYALFNDAIIEIAQHYNIPYIVQADDPFFQTDVYTAMAGGHPTAIGYSGMAEAFERLLNKCIVDNRSYFADAFMY